MTSPRPAVPKSLDDIHVESPCSQSWDAMKGDDRSRYCGECRLHVHDLSSMRRADAEAFVLSEKRAGRSLCVRFVRRGDGTVATSDLPPARRPATSPRWRAAAVGALAFLFPLAACQRAATGDPGADDRDAPARSDTEKPTLESRMRGAYDCPKPPEAPQAPAPPPAAGPPVAPPAPPPPPPPEEVTGKI
jgi:hypothetical protein